MQIVPYMPIHPAQLNQTSILVKDDREKPVPSSTSMDTRRNRDNDDSIFKRPCTPTPYTVEEPCDLTMKRAARMKRYIRDDNGSVFAPLNVRLVF